MHETLARIVLSADVAELTRLAAFITEFAGAHEIPEDVTSALQLSLEEVVTNVIRHGYGETGPQTVSVRLAYWPGEVTAAVEDDARPFDPLARPAPDIHQPVEHRPIGGLGIHLVRNLMDTMVYRRDGDKNRLTITKRWAKP